MLDKIQNWDKVVHLGIGAIAALCPVYPMAAILVVAFGKEIYDFNHPDVHTCDGLDAISTIVGGIMMLHLLGA